MTPPFGLAAYPIPTAAAHMNAGSKMTRASLFLRRIVVDSIRPSMKLQSPACVMIPTFPVSGYSATSGLEFVETIKDPHHVIGLGADLMRATRPMWQGNDISFTEFAGRGHAYARPALPDGQRAAHRFRGGEHEPDVDACPDPQTGSRLRLVLHDVDDWETRIGVEAGCALVAPSGNLLRVGSPPFI